METKYYIFLAATVVFIPVASCLGIRYRWAERALVAGTFFSTCYLIDINLLSMEWYRGDTRGFEFGVTDWMVISLIIVMARSPRWRAKRLTVLPPNSGPILLFLGIALLSAFAAYVPTYAAFGIFKLLRAIAVYWVGYNYLRSEADLRFILSILAAIVGLEFLLVLQQRQAGIYRAVGSTPHPNTLALYINMMNMIFLSFLINDGKDRIRRYVYLACVGAGSLIVLATFSRGGMTMMVACYALVIAMSIARRPDVRKLTIVLVMMVAAVPLGLKVAPSVIDRFLNAPVQSGLSREQANSAALAMANQHLLGVGINNYSHVVNETAYSAYIPGAFDRGIVHNIYLLQASELGWVGLAAFLLVIGNFLWRGLLLVLTAREGPAAWMAIGIFAGMISLWLQSFLEWAFRQTYLTVEFFMLAGFLAALPRLARVTRSSVRRRANAALVLQRRAAQCA
jgi:O-antigen ligase